MICRVSPWGEVTSSDLRTQGPFKIYVLPRTGLFSISKPISTPIYSKFNFRVLGIGPSALITTGITLISICQICHIFLAKSWYFSIYSSWLNSIVSSSGKAKSTILHIFCLIYCNQIWPSCLNFAVYLYGKTQQYLSIVIFQNIFWGMVIPPFFKFKSFLPAQLPMDNLSHIIVSLFIFLLC